MRNARRPRPSWRLGAIVVAAVVPLACAAFAIGSAVAAQPGTLFPGSSQLQGVFCTSNVNCWAVGFYAAETGALVNEITHWNGKKWSKAPVPSPAGTKSGDFNELGAVRCPSAANCWAVGFYFNSASSTGEALHWNGEKWKLIPTPAAGGTGRSDFTDLDDVACTSSTSCWAAGQYGHNGIDSETTFNLALHWNGKKWFKVTTPNPAGTKANDVNYLRAVRCASPEDCWAAGSEGTTSTDGVQLNEVLHWNGEKWSTATVPSPGGSSTGSYNAIRSLSCTSPGNCWAVGEYGLDTGSSYYLNEALHWNGHKWFYLPTPDPDGTAAGATNDLNSVNCGAASDCWAVGIVGDNSSGGSQTGEALHWQGTKWKLTATPNPAGTTDEARNSLNSVRCVSAKDCWIVGYSQVNGDPDVSLFLHWNSTKWSVGP
jgi:hypothetical protein